MSNLLTLSTAAKNAAADAVVDLADAGSANAAAEVWIKDSGATILAKLVMSNPAYGAASGGVATADTITDEDSALATGTAATFHVVDRDETEIYQGSCALSGGACNLNTLSILITNTVEITSMTYTQP